MNGKWLDDRVWLLVPVRLTLGKDGQESRAERDNFFRDGTYAHCLTQMVKFSMSVRIVVREKKRDYVGKIPKLRGGV